MTEEKKVDEVTGIDTTGHEWDGIHELNNPLPRWWLWAFYLTIVWGIGYSIAYPAWPLINSATSGLLGYSTRAELAADIAKVEERNADVTAQLAAADLGELAVDDPTYRFGVAGGAAVFRANCSQCHGSGAAGAIGYPNLLDDDWLWGGTVEEIEHTIRHGIRNDSDPDAHWTEMPAYGEILEAEEIASLTEFVLSISGQSHEASLVDAGAALFQENCAACHGDNGQGMHEQGAPQLNDAIWLYGGSRDAITETITQARFGVMPAWGPRLDEAEIKAVTLYVHQLGGGE